MSAEEAETGIVAKVKTEGGDTINVVDTGQSGIRYQRASDGQFLDSRIGEVVGRQNVQYTETPDSTRTKKRIYNDVYEEGKGLNPNRFDPSDTGEQRKVKSFMRNRGVRNAVKSNPLIHSSKEDEAREQLAKEVLEAFDNAGNSDRRRQRVIERYDLQS